MTTKEPTLEDYVSTGRLPVLDRGEQVIWDDRVAGLGLRLRNDGAPVWIRQRRIKGRIIKRSLGRLDAMGIEAARQTAIAMFDPDLLARTLPAPTFADFVPTYIDDNAGRWRPNTVISHRHDLMRHAVPVLGPKPVDAITRADVLAWLDNLKVAAGSRNRALAVLSGLMLHAETVGLRPEGSNPCAGLRRRQSSFKARYLDDQGFARLALALDQLTAAHPVEVALIRFVMLTGARRGEALTLEWTMIQGSQAVLPDSKTGPKTLWLCAPVRRLLSGLAKEAMSLRVFVMPDGRNMGGALDRVWTEARRLAGLEGLRLHDLRHSYASVAVSTGEDLKTVAGLLGHAELETTKGYAHLAIAPIQAAAGRIAHHLADAIRPNVPVEPIRPQPPEPPRPARQPKPAPVERQVMLSTPPAPKPAKKKRARKKSPSIAKATARYWRPHIDAFRQSDLRLDAFCRKHDLNPKRFHQAMIRNHKRRKAAREFWR